MKVSVIIPAYNAEKTIEKAISSIPQRNNIEIIVVNDGSTDGTVQVVQKMHETGKIKMDFCILTKKNGGVASAVNTGLDVAEGDYVVLLGSDDDFYTEEFEKAMEELDGTDLVYFDLKTNDGTIFHLDEKTKYGFCGSTKFMRKAFVGDLRNDETKKAGEDWFFFLELQKKKPTEKFTGRIVKHYNYPREGSLSDLQRKGEI